MRISTSKPLALFRKLKEDLQFAGFAVDESFDINGYPKLVLDTDSASISISQFDAVSKDIFGGDLKAAGPHQVYFASRNDAMDSIKVSKIFNEIAKRAFGKVFIQVHATSLSSAEAATPSAEIIADKQFPTTGM